MIPELLYGWTTSMAMNKHHYFFAHYILRMLAFAQPAHTLSSLASNGRSKFISNLLQENEYGFAHAEERDFSAADIQYFGDPIGERPCAILQMPPPSGPTEAYFIGIVGRVPMEELYAADNGHREEILIDYYTLERPAEITAESPSVLCGWTSEAHLNFGDGPQPTLEAFRSVLLQRTRTDGTEPPGPVAEYYPAT